MNIFKVIIILLLPVIAVSCSELSLGSKSTETSLKALKDSQNLLLDKITKLEKGQLDIKKTLATLNKPTAPSKDKPKKQQPKADPNKVYDVAIGNSIIEGDPNAPITIIEWMDYQ